MPIQQVTADDLEGHYLALKLASSSINIHHAVLCRRSGSREEKLISVNPMIDVERADRDDGRRTIRRFSHWRAGAVPIAQLRRCMAGDQPGPDDRRCDEMRIELWLRAVCTITSISEAPLTPGLILDWHRRWGGAGDTRSRGDMDRRHRSSCGGWRSRRSSRQPRVRIAARGWYCPRCQERFSQRRLHRISLSHD